MKKALTILLLATVTGCLAQVSQKTIVVDLPEMYREVDDAISRFPNYVHDYEQRIAEAKEAMPKAENKHQRLLLQMQVCKLYESFNGDSALTYALRCAADAHQLELADVEADYQARAAYLCTFLGSQTEALTMLGQIDRSKLSSEGLGVYFRAYLTSYEMLADNGKTDKLKKEYRRQHLRYLDSLLHAVDEKSELYCFYREDQLIKQGKLRQALKMNDERLNMSGPGSHQDAIIAYSRYRIYQKNGNRDLAIYWLCRSALADIRNAVMDQMSLISLAKELDAEGDFERASRYISFTWEANRHYSPHMRSWQIAPLLSAIEYSFQSKMDQKSRQYTYYIIGLAVVLLLTALAYLRIRFRYRGVMGRGENEADGSDEA